MVYTPPFVWPPSTCTSSDRGPWAPWASLMDLESLGVSGSGIAENPDAQCMVWSSHLQNWVGGFWGLNVGTYTIHSSIYLNSLGLFPPKPEIVPWMIWVNSAKIYHHLGLFQCIKDVPLTCGPHDVFTLERDYWGERPINTHLFVGCSCRDFP